MSRVFRVCNSRHVQSEFGISVRYDLLIDGQIEEAGIGSTEAENIAKRQMADDDLYIEGNRHPLTGRELRELTRRRATFP